MKRGLAILLVAAIVTAFVLVPWASARVTEGKVLDRIDFLNKDNIDWDVKADKPEVYWEPLGEPWVSTWLLEWPQNQARQDFMEGIVEAWENWAACGAEDCYEPDDYWAAQTYATDIWESTPFVQAWGENDDLLDPWGNPVTTMHENFVSYNNGDDAYEWWTNNPKEYTFEEYVIKSAEMAEWSLEAWEAESQGGEKPDLPEY